MTSPTERLPARDSTEHVRELVARGQQGDRDALEELYLIHFDRIYSYLHVSVGNRHDAEDLTTQTFLKMLEKIGTFKWRSAPFSAWLFRIAHNLAMDHFRSRRRWQPEEEVPEPCVSARVSARNSVVLPELGSPTIPTSSATRQPYPPLRQVSVTDTETRPEGTGPQQFCG